MDSPIAYARVAHLNRRLELAHPTVIDARSTVRLRQPPLLPRLARGPQQPDGRVRHPIRFRPTTTPTGRARSAPEVIGPAEARVIHALESLPTIVEQPECLGEPQKEVKRVRQP